MPNMFALISRAEFEKLAGKDPEPMQWLRVNRYDSTHPALDALGKFDSLYLLTVRPGDVPWFVQRLVQCKKDAKGWQGTASTVSFDLSPVRHLLRITKDAPAGKLAMSLQTPRQVSAHDDELIHHLITESSAAFSNPKRKKPWAAELPKWLLDDAAKKDAPPSAKKVVVKKAVKGVSKPRAFPKPLIDTAIGLIEEAVIPGDDHAKLLREPKRSAGLRGEFTESVQSIVDGVLGGCERGELLRMLNEELSGFVDGRSLAAVLKYEKDATLEVIVDQFALRAVDDVCRALLALALERPGDVPATCVSLVASLTPHVKRVQALLD